MLDDTGSAQEQPDAYGVDRLGSRVCKLKAQSKRRLTGDMAASLVELYGAGAEALVLSQPPERDVGIGSGVSWKELLPDVVRELARRAT